MARKVVSRIAKREEAEAAERQAESTKEKPTKKATKKKTTRRAKEPTEERKRLFWGVFDHSMKRVALFEFDQKDAADEKAEALSQSKKSPYFVQKVKEAVEE